MAKSFEDRIEEEVRKRLTNAASAAGVDRGRIELEILYMLPPEFVRGYRALFSRALADPVSPGPDGGKDEGRIKAAGKPADPLKARSMGGAAGGGKRFVRGAWPVRDEAALEVKNKIDRKILTLIREVPVLLSRAIGAGGIESEAVPFSNNQCISCGRFQRPEWQRCPFHPAVPG